MKILIIISVAIVLLWWGVGLSADEGDDNKLHISCYFRERVMAEKMGMDLLLMCQASIWFWSTSLPHMLD